MQSPIIAWSIPLFAQLIFLLTALAVLVLIYFIQYRKLKSRMSFSKMREEIKEKELIEQLINNMPDRIYYKDRNSKFLLANIQTARVMGESDPKNLIGKTDFDYYDEKYARSYYDDEQRIMQEGVPMISKEEKGLDLNGNEIFVSTTKIPVRNRREKVIGIIGIGRDITPQKEVEEKLKESNQLLEEQQEEIKQLIDELNTQADNLQEVNTSLERLSLVASKTENTVIIMDVNANFEWANEGFEKQYGMDLESFKKEYGQNLRDNSSNENISGILNQIYITKKPYTYNSRFSRRNGEETWNQTNIFPILDAKNEISNLILIDSDISDLKLAEKRIKQQNREIRTQARELQKTNSTKDRIFSIIAHDLKNPFHTIMGFIEIIQDQFDELDREKLQEYLDMIRLSSSSAYQLLQDLLDWARTQTGKVSFEPSNLVIKEIAGEVISLLQLQASEKGVILIDETDPSIRCFADKKMIGTILRNLAGNAIKYSRKGDTITFAAQRNKNEITVSVADTGIGMTEEMQRNLFQLEKVISRAGTAGESGTGLGLLVCDEFTRINKGKMSVSSLPDRGSTFSFTLPAATK